MLITAALAAQACATLPAGSFAEPPVIVVRNRSGADIATVTLRETSRTPDRALRFGSLSPVPAGASQSYVRPKDPPRFPKTVTLEWIDRQGQTHVRDLSVAPALRSATGAADELLVFEIGPYEDVLVLVERTAQPGPAGAGTGIDLQGSPWLLIELKGTIVQMPAGERQPFIMLQRQEKRATGYLGCNEFFGNYELKGDTLTFGPLGMTRRFCAGAAGEVEQSLLEVLSKVLSWRIEERVLLFLDGDLVLARFRQEGRSPAPH
jgi:heat shock protein HslJ